MKPVPIHVEAALSGKRVGPLQPGDVFTGVFLEIGRLLEAKRKKP